MASLPDIEARLGVLITEILVSLRSSKTVDSAAMDKLYDLTDEIAAEMVDSDTVPRLLTGKLWFIFTQMLSEAGH